MPSSRLLLFSICAAAAAAGCTRPDTPDLVDEETPAPAVTSLAPETIAGIYARSDRRIANGTLCKPRRAGEEPFDLYLAPMILQEAIAPEAGKPAETFGAIARGDDGRAITRAGRPTVYFTRSTALLGGREHEQLAFVWWYPAATPESEALRAQGVRVTFGEGGLAVVWELLADATGARVVFVAETVEQAARDQYGAPLEERRFSVERSLDDAPTVVVARAISAGTTPMGPFVYLDAATRSAHTVICRCMPSEFGTLSGDSFYELADLDSLRTLGLEKSAWTASLPRSRGAREPRALEIETPDWLEQNLRLPERL